jgi:type I restriction enzyme S subunit
VKHNWKTYRLGDFLERQYDSVTVEDFSKYKRITIKTKGQGIELRDEVEGLEIGTKNQFKVKANQFLLSKIDAMNGAFGIVPEECNEGIITGNFWTYNLDDKIIEREYLRLLCVKQVFTEFSIEASEGTTNRKYLRENKFLNLPISLPPLAEQQRIVAKIESVKNKIEEIKKLRAEQEIELNNLRYSIFLELEKNYSSISIGDVLINQNRSVTIEPDKIYKQVTVSGNHKGVSLRCLIKGSEIGSKQYLAKKGDFIISKIDARNAAMGMITEELDEALVTGDFPLFGFNNNINPLFFYHFSNTPYFDNACKEASEGTTNRVRIKMDRFYNIQIPLPPMEEQNRIVSLLEKLNLIKQSHQQQQEIELNQLLPSLLDKAFKGELFVENSVQIQNGVYLPAQQKEIELPLAATAKNDDLEIAMIVALIESKLGNTYGEVGIQKTVFNLEAFNPTLNRKYNFVNYHYGTYSAELKERIKANSYLGKKEVKGSEVFTISPTHKKAVLNALSDKANQHFVMAVNSILDLYSSPFIGKHTDKIELLNTVTKLIIDLQTTDVNLVYEGMKKWTIKQQGFNTKADKFNITDTKKTIELLKSNGLIEKLIHQE